MLRFTSKKQLFITYGERSEKQFAEELFKAAEAKFGQGDYTNEAETLSILDFCYRWLANRFKEIMHSSTDARFLYYLFANHESSIHLYYQTAELDFEKEGINTNELSLNRRILKLAIEQACDIDYISNKDIDPKIVPGFIATIEDLLYLGERLFGFSEFMAEQRMMENPIEVLIKPNEVKIQRQYHYDQIYHVMEKFFQEGFSSGLVDNKSVAELRQELKTCMGINYDFAGGQIFKIKEHHSPKAPIFQTIQREALIQNLIANGVDEKAARTFYEGLTISRKNKLSIEDSVYQSGSFKRYMFRPILMVSIDGEERAWVGEEKWHESILVMATNGFQWQLAPDEWMANECFKQFLDRKHDEHDKLLEHAVIKILKDRHIYYRHHITNLTRLNGKVISILKEPGEIDFIIIDPNVKKILVTDCKYNRARYEMAGFSNDFRGFKNKHEKQIGRKYNYVRANLQIIKEDFQVIANMPDIDLSDFAIEEFIIVNTPTFYVLNGVVKTITIGHLAEFIDEDKYDFSDLAVKDGGEVKLIHRPYFTIQ